MWVIVEIVKTKFCICCILLNDGEEKNYHLWITSDGEGYIQRLRPDGNATLKLDQTSVLNS